ncbi:MAG: prepilin-type N-terminal cleavage/methylation domain-containing protein [Candidatus Paceibacterota bacterium]|jgi:Tfp pilus assembly protein PilV
MKTSSLNLKRNFRGMTLIEVIIFTVLLSFLITGFIQYAFIIYEENIQLINDVNGMQA